MKHTMTGIDQLKSYFQKKKMKMHRVGILCHPSSVSSKLEHLQSLTEKSTRLTALFGPQHGIHGETQDNMIEWQDTHDAEGRPVYSLYGERRKPSKESIENLDLMIIDLFDVGARYYTFIYTMAYVLEVCGELGVPVLICDRPNPLGGLFVEGPILNLEFKSFVGLYEIPVCHGMSIAELALLFASKMPKAPQIEILKCRFWKRSQDFPKTGLLWTLPSPNMPSYLTARLYPGMCLLEGTTLSEGRGTTRPFELIGAPFFNWNDINREYLKLCKDLKIKPVHFHRQGFIPTFHKYSGQLCHGALQIPPEKNFYPLRHASILLWVFRHLYADQWSWKQPPYEYEYEKLPIDILAGSEELRKCVDQQTSLKRLFSRWKEDENKFKKQRRPFLLYK